MKQIQLRDFRESDKEFLFTLANEKECRANSFTQDKITWEEHCRWFKKVQSSEDVKIYILVENDSPVGQGRLEKRGDSYRLSYSIVPERRGMGYGKILIACLEEEILKRIPECRKVFAEVLKSNAASQKVFEDLGYDLKVKERLFYYEKMLEASLKKYVKAPAAPGGGGIAFK